jgi:hypothetical protein
MGPAYSEYHLHDKDFRPTRVEKEENPKKAEGAPETRDKMVTEASHATHDIFFTRNRASIGIKPYLTRGYD